MFVFSFSEDESPSNEGLCTTKIKTALSKHDNKCIYEVSMNIHLFSSLSPVHCWRLSQLSQDARRGTPLGLLSITN